MSNPSVSSIAVPIALQNLTIQYRNRDFIGDRVFPILAVPTLQSKVMKYSKANMFRMTDGELYRAEGDFTKRFNYNVETQNVNPKQISAEVPVTDELVDIASQPGQLPLQPLIDAVQHCSMKIDNYKEKLIADTIFGNTWADGVLGGVGATGTWGLTTTGNTMISDIFAAKATVLKATGVEPNKLIIDYSTFIAIQSNPVIADKIKYTQKAVLTADLLASLLQLDEVLIGRAIYTTQKETKGTPSFIGQSMWNPSGKGNAFLFYQEEPGLRALGAGYQYRLPYMGALRFVRGYRDERVRSTIYQVTEQVDIAPVALDVGYAWKNTITA